MLSFKISACNQIDFFFISRVSHGLDDLFEQTMHKERVNLVRKRQVVSRDSFSMIFFHKCGKIDEKLVCIKFSSHFSCKTHWCVVNIVIALLICKKKKKIKKRLVSVIYQKLIHIDEN